MRCECYFQTLRCVCFLLLKQNYSVYPDRDDNANACNEWAADGMSQDMYLLGSVLLHEYT